MILKKFFHHKVRIIFLLVLAVVIAVEIVILLLGKAEKKYIPPTPSEIISYAEKIVSNCANAKYKPSCYDKEIPKLMDPPIQLSMGDTFQVTDKVQGMDSTYQYCHVLGHAISAREVNRDPSKWKDVVSQCPSGFCSNGCIHGGFQEKFRKENLTDQEIPKVLPDLKTICERRPNWNPTDLEQAACYHALGHLAMYISNANAKKATEICDIVAKKEDKRDFTRPCYDGAFMQIYQPLEPEDFALVKGKQPTKDRILEFCSNYKGPIKASCISESWPLYKGQIFESAKGLIDFCSLEEPAYRERCYIAMFYVMTVQLNFNLDRIVPYCESLPTELKPLCFTNVASRFIETDYSNIDKSVELCNQASSSDPENQCYKMLLTMSKYNFHSRSKEFYQLCNSLPSEWKEKCLQ